MRFNSYQISTESTLIFFTSCPPPPPSPPSPPPPPRAKGSVGILVFKFWNNKFSFKFYFSGWEYKIWNMKHNIPPFKFVIPLGIVCVVNFMFFLLNLQFKTNSSSIPKQCTCQKMKTTFQNNSTQYKIRQKHFQFFRLTYSDPMLTQKWNIAPICNITAVAIISYWSDPLLQVINANIPCTNVIDSFQVHLCDWFIDWLINVIDSLPVQLCDWLIDWLCHLLDGEPVQ